MPLYIRLPLYLCPYTPASRPAFSSVNDIQYATPHPLLCLRVRRALVSAWHVCAPSTQVLFGLIIRYTTYTNHSDSRTPVIPDLSTPNAVNFTIPCPNKPRLYHTIPSRPTRRSTYSMNNQTLKSDDGRASQARVHLRLAAICAVSGPGLPTYIYAYV